MSTSRLILLATWLSSLFISQTKAITFDTARLSASNAKITRFEVSLVIPNVSPDKTPAGDVQALWPGLEPAAGNTVLQNVITNQGGGAGEWYLLPYTCCSPAKNLMGQMRVYPGDVVKNVYALDETTGDWFVNWVVIPSPRGGTGQVSFGGGLRFDPSSDAADKGEPYTQMILAIELQGTGTWDFGFVEWRDLILEVNSTTSAAWCTDGPTDAEHITWKYSTPVATTIGNSTTCYIARVLFEGPGQTTDSKREVVQPPVHPRTTFLGYNGQSKHS